MHASLSKDLRRADACVKMTADTFESGRHPLALIVEDVASERPETQSADLDRWGSRTSGPSKVWLIQRASEQTDSNLRRAVRISAFNLGCLHTCRYRGRSRKVHSRGCNRIGSRKAALVWSLSGFERFC
eukprot:2372330-Amphidinium_carterae.1